MSLDGELVSVPVLPSVVIGGLDDDDELLRSRVISVPVVVDVDSDDDEGDLSSDRPATTAPEPADGGSIPPATVADTMAIAARLGLITAVRGLSAMPRPAAAAVAADDVGRPAADRAAEIAAAAGCKC